jgi:hypothetical protein
VAKRRRSGSTAPVSIAPTDQRETVSISKIENGYLIEKSGVKHGKYYSHREFSPGKPSVVASVPKPEPQTKRKSAPRKPVALREVGFLRGER